MGCKDTRLAAVGSAQSQSERREENLFAFRVLCHPLLLKFVRKGLQRQSLEMFKFQNINCDALLTLSLMAEERCRLAFLQHLFTGLEPAVL